MILVALLRGSVGDAALQARLATAARITAYEARLALAGGFPAIVLTTPDEARAAEVAHALRQAGDDALACDARSLVSADRMIALDRFTLGERSVTTASAELLYADVACLVRAVHRSRTAVETRTTERRFSAGKSLLTGGLSNTKTVSTSTKESTDAREGVLYVFPRHGATPWILREIGTHYEGLGGARGLTTVENFATTVRLLRERAPHAAFDDRLTRVHRAAERATLQGTTSNATVTTSSASGIDVLAHLVAVVFSRA